MVGKSVSVSSSTVVRSARDGARASRCPGGKLKAPMSDADLLATLSAEAKLTDASRALLHAAAAAAGGAGVLLAQWVDVLNDERPAFLRLLQRVGLDSLPQRQALANAIGRAQRESRLPAPSRPITPPSLEELEREAAMRLRASSDPLLAGIDGSERGALDDAKLLAALPRACDLRRVLETAGMRPSYVSKLLAAMSRRATLESSTAAVKAAATPGLRIGFYSNQLCERGTEVALFDYADFAERLLECVAFILYDASSPKNVDASVSKFRTRFGSRVRPLGPEQPFADLADCIRRESISHCYIIKFGEPDQPSVTKFVPARTLVHAVFDARSPHGDVYARISPCVPGPVPVVPHIVRRRNADGHDLRAELGIPLDATVFGRHVRASRAVDPLAQSSRLSSALPLSLCLGALAAGRLHRLRHL